MSYVTNPDDGPTDPAPYTPDIAIPPGATIKEMLGAMGMTEDFLAEKLRLPAAYVSHVIEGKRPISLDMAGRLEQVLPYPAAFWLNLEKNYRVTLAALKTS